ncbi:dTDP-glucose 4,6-dehydratase [Candidatus Pelagibacter sp.]|nr:dTDP-glucose 4,6-dehydratase [Candidatus Pelagibacter sp.]
MNKNIIITGGLGFIGSNLVNYLIKKKFSIINIDKLSYSSNFYNLEKIKNNAKYKFIKSDIGNNKKIYEILKKYKPKAIFNLAAETHVDRSIDGPKNFIKSNIVSLFNLLETCKKYYKKNKDIKLIHISTDEVYGDILIGRSKENDSYKPSSPYAASKASSDHLVYSYFRTYNLPVIITNCSNNYGPNQHPEKLIPKLIYNIINNLPLPIYGNGKNSREWIHVEDHCNALFKIFNKGKIGNFYNIGSGKNLSNIEVVKLLLNISKKFLRLGPNVEIQYVCDRPGHDTRYALNCNKINKQLKWSSKIDIKKGLENTFQWYLNNKKYFKLLKKKDFTKRLGK